VEPVVANPDNGEEAVVLMLQVLFQFLQVKFITLQLVQEEHQMPAMEGILFLAII